MDEFTDIEEIDEEEFDWYYNLEDGEYADFYWNEMSYRNFEGSESFDCYDLTDWELFEKYG